MTKTDISFSQALREGTWSDHSESEGAGFMEDLMKGRGTREDYIALVAQHFFMYEALEGATEAMRENPVAAPFISDALIRMPAVQADLEFLLGADWRDRIEAVPATRAYADRITEVAATDPGAFVAHHYTRYLGDLSGGQFISRLMQRHFGLERQGVEFYAFDELGPIPEFKDAYRAKLDEIGLDQAGREALIAEARVAYGFNTEVFVDLARAKKAQ
ncbi:biliverdin-producing heme oxygenase [Leucobacter sp. M11]|uniref:biliverdin-producing heme oxygenase n=1 Tax=Leucobacter sp. M11 TaxID=2993565 RepID=UPI002D7FFA21|nr:biliverdin-producing heme oxygenase [Leucobacter sp. M11]MEB4614832.1 biliverdin-producing heme oxygenase [Leucobacter sp. M11]